MTVHFYSKTDDYYWLSNFSRHGFELDGKYWLTVEHFFQAQKFVTSSPEYAERIRKAPGPKEAKSLGRSRKVPLRADWEDVKDDVMRRAVAAKFQKHDDLRELLLATGSEELIEKAPSDYYWGCGRSGTGRNMLGKILMETRENLGESSTLPKGGDD